MGGRGSAWLGVRRRPGGSKRCGSTCRRSAGNVVTTGSGTVDLTGLSFTSSGERRGICVRLARFSGCRVVPEADDFYSGAIGPASFGTGGFIIPFGQSGDLLGLIGNVSPAEILVPHGYVSGTSLSGSSTYVGQTFASLGLTAGNSNLYTRAAPRPTA